VALLTSTAAKTDIATKASTAANKRLNMFTPSEGQGSSKNEGR
jgi:hypothetical protein